MRAVVQRVLSASVSIDGKVVGSCGFGLLVLVGAHKDDTEENALKLADRVAGMRIFNDKQGKMNLSFSQALSLKQVDATGEPFKSSQANTPIIHQSSIINLQPPPGVLAVSNFTVYGDASQRRPSFTSAAPYERGQGLFNFFVNALRAKDVPTETGVFGADMQVSLINDGPVTLVIDC